MSELARFPTGTLTYEILSAEIGRDESEARSDGHGEQVRALKFRATIIWPSR
jgi:hypothetical protein